jgi:hypothetical protein
VSAIWTAFCQRQDELPRPARRILLFRGDLPRLPDLTEDTVLREHAHLQIKDCHAARSSWGQDTAAIELVKPGEVTSSYSDLPYLLMGATKTRNPVLQTKGRAQHYHARASATHRNYISRQFLR